MAAVLMLAVLVAGFFLLVLLLRLSSQRTPPPPQPKAYIILRQPRGEVPAVPDRFLWQPVNGAAKYKVTISDDDAVWPLLVRVTSETSLTLSGKEMLAIAPGRIHVWEVEALGPDGLPMATGGVRFRVTPPGSAEEGAAPSAGASGRGEGPHSPPKQAR